MLQRIQSMPLRLFILFTTTLALSACGSESNQAVSPDSNPPAFDYNPGQDFRSGMAELGMQLALLDRELIESEYNQIDQQDVTAILQEMEMIGSSLQATDAGETHLFIQDDMPAFVDAIRNARNAASASPPNYYLAGRVAGACVNCHEVNR